MSRRKKQGEQEIIVIRPIWWRQLAFTLFLFLMGFFFAAFDFGMEILNHGLMAVFGLVAMLNLLDQLFTWSRLRIDANTYSLRSWFRRIELRRDEVEDFIFTEYMARRLILAKLTVSLRRTGWPWVISHPRLPRKVFRSSIAWLSDSLSTLRSAGYPYTTQDSLPVAGQALLHGISTRKVPTKGFKVVIYISFPFPKLCLAQLHRPLAGRTLLNSQRCTLEKDTAASWRRAQLAEVCPTSCSLEFHELQSVDTPLAVAATKMATGPPARQAAKLVEYL